MFEFVYIRNGRHNLTKLLLKCCALSVKMDYQLAAGASALYLITKMYKHHKNRRSRRKLWCRSWINRRNGDDGSNVLSMLNTELKIEDPLAYRNFLRMDNMEFEHILNLVANSIKKEDTVLRESISARSRLEVTLRFLAAGETYRSLMYATRIHESTISKFVPEVCKAIIDNLKNDYLRTPSTTEEWKSIAEGFQNRWQFPQCLGALDGKHIKFRAPISEGSYYYNYKGEHSIVLLGLANANYQFTYVNIGVNGRISDGGVFQECTLSTALFDNSLNLPPASKLLGRGLKVPYVIVTDAAFSLSTKIMKPYPSTKLTHDNKIFNYRLSRARRIIENAFGILSNRFRILLNPINLSPEKVETITLTCVLLHNFLIKHGKNYINSKEKQNKCPLSSISAQNYQQTSTATAHKVRDEFRDYFVSDFGKVEWQEEAVRRHNL